MAENAKKMAKKTDSPPENGWISPKMFNLALFSKSSIPLGKIVTRPKISYNC